MSRNYLVTADALGSGNAVALHNIYDKNPKIMVQAADLSKEVHSAMLDAKGWLPFASEVYNISANMDDYVMVPVILMPSDLPNRNVVGFPFRELTRFNPEAGSVMFKTWKGKPTHYEHQNADITKAKGVIFDSTLRKLNHVQGNVWKVVALCGFDRTRDAHLANEILTGENTSYSMGAMCRDYTCSICNHHFSQGACDHLEAPGKNAEFRIINGHLAYWQAEDPIGFETSFVHVPAYTSAQASRDQILKFF